MKFDKRRLHTYKKIDEEVKGFVVYWCRRDNRINDNWALYYAQKLALKFNVGLVIVKTISDDLYYANNRTFKFYLDGLKEFDSTATKYNIPIYYFDGKPAEKLNIFFHENNCNTLITDFNPLIEWDNELKYLINNTHINILEVDAHNIVPCKVASNKEEFGAYTLRPKVNKLLDEFLELPDEPEYHKQNDNFQVNYKGVGIDFFDDKFIALPNAVKINSGENEANKILTSFIDFKLSNYNQLRNDPAESYQSTISPYLNHGFISAIRIVKEIKNTNIDDENTKAFLEELIVRRELADNYCHYNKNYNNFNGFHIWAKTTLNEHRLDIRDYVYSIEDWEKAKTHDTAWNAAQLQLIEEGRMHGYMRMYWAKKILEWTESVEIAMETAIYLNDKYALDGRDPNGFTGIAWSIGGVHDRAWTQRNVYGKIRYMNYNGLKRKIDIKKYEDKYLLRANNIREQQGLT